MNDELITLAAEIRDLHQEILGIMILDSESWKRGGLGDLFERYEDARRRLRVLVHDGPQILLPDSAHADARRVLQASLLNEMPLDWLLAGDEGVDNIDFTTEEIEAVVEDYLSWFSYLIYADNKLNAAALVLRAETLPETAHHLVAEIIECYAFERYTAVYALARVVLESTLRDVYARAGLAHPDSPNAQIVRDRVQESRFSSDERRYLTGSRVYSDLTLDDFSPSLNQMIRRLCLLPEYEMAVVVVGLMGSEPLEGILHRIRERGNSLLHGNRTADRTSARAMMHDLFRALHILYEVTPDAEGR